MENKPLILGRKVTIIGEYNGVSVSLVEKFLANFFSVKVVCVKIDLWRKHAPYLFSNNHFELLHLDSDFFLGDEDIVIFVSTFFDNLFGQEEKKVLQTEIKRFSFFLYSVGGKKGKFFILPNRVYDKISLNISEVCVDSALSQKNSFIFLCFVDEIFGPRMILSDRNEFSSLLLSFLGYSQNFYSSNEVDWRLLYVGDFVRSFLDFVLRSDFKQSKKVFFRGRKTDKETLFLLLQKKLLFDVSKLNKINVYPRTAVFDEVISLDSPLSREKLFETIEWFQKNKDDFFVDNQLERFGADLLLGGVSGKDNARGDSLESNFLRSVFFPKIKLFFSNLFLIKVNISFKKINCVAFLRSVYGKFLFVVYRTFAKKITDIFYDFFKGLSRVFSIFFTRFLRFNFFPVLKLRIFYLLFRVSVAFAFVFLFLPLMLSFFGVFLLYFGYRNFKSFNFSVADPLLNFSEKYSCYLHDSYYNFSRTPVLRGYYLFLASGESILCNSSHALVVSNSLVKKASLLYSSFLEGREVDVNYFSRQVFADLDALYFNMFILEGKLVEFGEKYRFFSFWKKKFDLSAYQRILLHFRDISLLLPDILGKEGEKNYLVLFQNNMELRPTGGFIGSFAVLKIDNGVFSNLEVYDVYDVDGQLKGYVEPPWQIKSFLNEASWYLRDSNWDPDFSVSAKRAQWFLNKSVGIKVDGVISFDISFVKDMISVMGGITVPDYSVKIDTNNFYDIVQFEAEKNFFAGSRQKDNFLTALSRAVLFELKNSDSRYFFSLLPVIYRNLNERHIQLFFNKQIVQEKISSLGWDGGIDNNKVCFSENCFRDFVALVESNFGVNKANYFVTRGVNMKIWVEEEFVKREMEVVFENKAPLVLGDRGKYKNYLRVFLPSDIFVEKAVVQEGDYSNDVVLDEEVVDEMKSVGLLIEILPESVKKVVLVWKSRELDLSRNGDYIFVFRKQAGLDSLSFNLKVFFPLGFRPAYDGLQLTKDGFFVYNQESQKTDFFARFYW